MARSDDAGGAAAREALDTLTKTLRRWRPAKVRAIVDGEPRDIALPGSKRRRWEAVAKLLLQMEWSRVELLDAKGALLEFVEADDAAVAEEGEGVVDVERFLGKAPAGMDREHGLLVLLLKGQEVVLRHQAATLATVTDGYRTLTETVFNRLVQMETMFGKTLQMAHDAAQRVNASAGDADPNDALLLQLLEKSGVLGGGNGQVKKFESLLGRAEKLLGGAAAPAKKIESAPANGVAKGG